MNDEDAIVPDDTGKQTAVAPAQEVSSPFPPEQVPATQIAPEASAQPATQTRSPEFGDAVLYVHGDRILNATVQVAFANGICHLRVVDPEHQLGQFDVQGVEQDTQRASGTFHYAQESL